MRAFKEHDMVNYRGKKARIIHLYGHSKTAVIEFTESIQNEPGLKTCLLRDLKPVKSPRKGSSK